MTLAAHTIETSLKHFDPFDSAEASIDNFQSTFNLFEWKFYAQMHISFDFSTSTSISTSVEGSAEKW